MTIAGVPVDASDPTAVAMTYGPLASWMVELFPALITLALIGVYIVAALFLPETCGKKLD